MAIDGVGLLMAAFLAVTFLQSGLDKALNWAGNATFIRGYFEKTPLRRPAVLLLALLTLQELAAGVCCAAGALLLVLGRPEVALVGATLGAFTFLCLFLGTRLAKDYAGASGLVPYFGLSCAAVLVLSAAR